MPRDVVTRAADAVRPIAGGQISIEPTLAKLSVVGVGMRTHTGVATRMFGALAKQGININLINTSEIRINVGTDLAKGKEALDCLRKVFALRERILSPKTSSRGLLPIALLLIQGKVTRGTRKAGSGV